MILLGFSPFDLYLLPAITAFFTAALSGYVSYQIAKRQHSGKIETSAAEDLWRESKSIRDALREQNEHLTKTLEEAHTDRLRFKQELEGVKLQLVEAQGSNKRLESKLIVVQDENEMLRGANLALARRVTELETKSAIPTVLAPVTVVTQSPIPRGEDT